MSNIIEFNDFKVDLSARKILRNEKQVNIQKKPFELLLYLIENKDRVISKDELIEEVWNGSIVSDNTLSHAIFKLRVSLRDNKGKENIIRTARGFGFQFIAEIKQPEQHIPSTLPEPKKHKLLHKTIGLLIAVLFLAFLVLQNLETKKELDINTADERYLLNTNKAIAIVAQSDNQDEDWLYTSLTHYMNQLMAYSENSDSQLLFLINNDSNDSVLFNLEEENKIMASFANDNISLAFHSKPETIHLPLKNIPDAVNEINLWLCSSVFPDKPDCQTQLNELTSDNAFILENYLRGVHANRIGETQKAINYFNICLQENSGFRIARYELAKSYFYLSQYTKSIAQLQTIITTANNHRLINQSYILLGKSYFRTSDYKKSEESYLKIINNNQTDQKLKAHAYIEIAEVYQEVSDLTKAFTFAKQGNDILKSMKTPLLLARSYKIMGSIKNAEGDLDQSEKYLIQALNLYEDLNELNGIEATLSQLGSIFQSKGDLSTSLAYATRRQAIVERLGDPIGIAGSHLQLAYLLLEMGNLDQASFHANKMWEIAVKTQEPRAQMMAGLILGEIASSKNHFQQSLDHYNHALNISRELGLIRREVIMLCNMGKVAIDGVLFDKASEYLTLCKNSADESDYTLFQAVARLYLGELYRLQDLAKQSETFLNDALKIANTIKNDDIKKGIQLEYFYLFIKNNLAKAEYHLQLVPDSYKESFLYLIAKAELEFKKQNYEEAYNLALQAKQISGDNWSTEDKNLFEKIKGKI